MDEPRGQAPLRDAGWYSRFRRRLAAWYPDNARDLPWRNDISPYRTWVSEIMLQQTQVATVIPYFGRFMQSFPSVVDLARASEDLVLKHWEGLGYYRRARQLHRAAQVIVEEHDGVFPADKESISKLPGIGRYTTGAILSIALGQRQPILEANTVRLFARILAWDQDVTKASSQKQLWRFAEEVLPQSDCGDFNQALMELGSQVCRPQEPNCNGCPVAKLCESKSQNLQHAIPAPKKKMKYIDREEVAVVVRKGNQVLLRRCTEAERWAGLWDYPRFTLEQKPSGSLSLHLAELVRERTGAEVDVEESFLTIKHGVTKYRITLHCHYASFQRGKLIADAEIEWVPVNELASFPLSITGREISDAITGKKKAKRLGTKRSRK